jgi:hypothetical protein
MQLETYGGLHKMGNSNDFYFEVEDVHSSFKRFINSKLDFDINIIVISDRKGLEFNLHYDKKQRRIINLESSKYPKSYENIVSDLDTFLIELRKIYEDNKKGLEVACFFDLNLKDMDTIFNFSFGFDKKNEILLSIEEYQIDKMGSEDLLKIIKFLAKLVKPIGIYHDPTQHVYGLKRLKCAGFERNDVLFSDRKRDKFVNLKKKLDEITGKRDDSNIQKITKTFQGNSGPKDFAVIMSKSTSGSIQTAHPI